MTGATQPAALEIDGLVKCLGGTGTVDHLSLGIAQGEIHALLGPSGAGKTTVLRIVAGLLQPDRGGVHVLGHDLAREPEQARHRLAFLPDDPLVCGKLRPLEYLELVAGLSDIAPEAAAPRAEELLRRLGLWAHSPRIVEGCPRGMRQKLALAGALLLDPRLLILDEPLAGLDEAGVRQVKDLLQERVARGRTVLLATRSLAVAERLAQRISIVRDGRITAQGSADELRERAVACHAPDVPATDLDRGVNALAAPRPGAAPRVHASATTGLA
jgi:ABC-2 type transport system ATP-binding protein